MSNKTPKANKNETASAPKPSTQRIWKKYKVGLFAGVLAGLMLFVWSMTPGGRTIDDTCTIISNETSQEEVCVQLERVSSPADVRQGLSGREELALEEGMLFDFGREAEHCMWMKDMNFALDIIWLDNDGTVVSALSNVSPESYPEVFCNEEAPARYVLEVNAGIAEMAHIVPGQQIEL